MNEHEPDVNPVDDIHQIGVIAIDRMLKTTNRFDKKGNAIFPMPDGGTGIVKRDDDQFTLLTIDQNDQIVRTQVVSTKPTIDKIV